MHFQIPPKSHFKMMYCINGKVLDVIIDLRLGSPTYLKVVHSILNGKNPEVIFLPPGIAHGFLSLKQNSIMMYKVTTSHSPEHDYGVRWDSINFSWPINNPIISYRDSQLPRLSEFVTPFVFSE